MPDNGWDWKQALDDLIDDARLKEDEETATVYLDAVVDLLRSYTQEQRDLMLAGWIAAEVSDTVEEDL